MKRAKTGNANEDQGSSSPSTSPTLSYQSMIVQNWRLKYLNSVGSVSVLGSSPPKFYPGVKSTL